MSVLRLVIAWLVMAALPLQGMAAASMLFCGQAAHTTVAAHGAHDHATHALGGSAHAHHGHVDAHASPADAGEATADDGHACPICASCSNLVALSEPPSLSLAAHVPASQPSHGASRVLTREASTPDKPPRA